MIVTTIDTIPGREVTEILGVVRGASVRARHLGKDISAFLTNIVGGEMEDYTKLLAEVREQAIDRMMEDARARGANAVVGMRFVGTEIAQGAAEILAYGTGVRLAE